MDVAPRRNAGWAQGLLVAIACSFVIACDQESLLQSITPEEDRALGLQIVRALQTGDDEKILVLVPAEVKDKLRSELPRMRGLVPHGPATTIKLVEAHATLTTATGKAVTRESYQTYGVDQGTKHALIRLGYQRVAGQVLLTGFYVNALDRPADELGAFTLSGKAAAQYLFLVLALLSPLTIAAALFVLYRATNVKQKWLWAVGCLIGIGQISMNWSSGAWAYTFLGAQLFGFGATKMGIGPWQIAFGVPVVAYWFLLRQVHLRNRGAADAAPP